MHARRVHAQCITESLAVSRENPFSITNRDGTFATLDCAFRKLHGPLGTPRLTYKVLSPIAPKIYNIHRATNSLIEIDFRNIRGIAFL